MRGRVNLSLWLGEPVENCCGSCRVRAPALEQLLTQKIRRAIFIEAWGELYARDHLGIHQVHSQRASCSASRDYRGRDGAIRIYFEENSAAEMLLLKYCGQV